MFRTRRTDQAALRPESIIVAGFSLCITTPIIDSTEDVLTFVQQGFIVTLVTIIPIMDFSAAFIWYLCVGVADTASKDAMKASSP